MNDPSAPRVDLAALVAPLSVAAFLRDHWETAPALLRGSSERALGIVSLADIVRAMTGVETPAGKFMVDAERIDPRAVPSAGYVATLGGAIPLGTEPIWAYLEAGNAIVWNGARGATPALDALSASLARALGARVWPNLYATGPERAPFDMHFDSHEVLVLQIEGRKTWQISGVRFDRPLDLPGMKSDVDAGMASMRGAAAEDIVLEATVEPGDVVYVPRGQFHNARAVGGRSLHVTFGVVPLSGLDVLEALAEIGLRDPVFRAYFPPHAGDESGDGRRAAEERVASRIAELLENGEVTRALDAILARRIATS
ncbi:MAG: cupin domain-containing protein [Polyangiaceae bacterium]